MVNRLLTPTHSYLARSRSAVSLSGDAGTYPSPPHTLRDSKRYDRNSGPLGWIPFCRLCLVNSSHGFTVNLMVLFVMPFKA